jgi:hypothetical protein
VTLEGTESFSVTDSLFERIDGNGVMLNGFNRNATIASNEFSWVGATCVASWGYSSECVNGNCSFKIPWREGPDARGGEQPRGTRILNNLFRVSELASYSLSECTLYMYDVSYREGVPGNARQEMGIYQKQASAYFHAKSGLTEVAGAPRACTSSSRLYRYDTFSMDNCSGTLVPYGVRYGAVSYILHHTLCSCAGNVVFNGPRAMFNFVRLRFTHQ